MRTAHLMIAALLFLVVCTRDLLAQTGGKPTDSIWAADTAWNKTYEAKDLDKAVAFCDEQGSLLWPNAPLQLGRTPLPN
jgi:hypothetical protein